MLTLSERMALPKKTPPDPPTMEAALAAIEESKLLTAEAETLRAQAKVIQDEMMKLYAKADNFPFGIMRTLGFALGQVWREKKTGKFAVVSLMREGMGEVQLNELTKRNTVSHTADRRIGPLKWPEWEFTGYEVKPDWRNNYWGVLVPAHKRQMKPGPIREIYLTGE